VSDFAGMGAAALAAGPLGIDDTARLRGKNPEEVAREFEAILFTQMISAMRKTVPQSDLLEASPDRQMLDGAFDQEIARSLVARGDLGVAKEIAAQLRGRTPAASSSSAAAVAPSSGAEAVGRASLASPLAEPTRVASGFGTRIDPIDGEPAFHAGIDLEAPLGADVRAVAAGKVVFSGERGRAGNLVEVEHADGSVSSYAHLDQRLVSEGAAVAAGTLLGTVGSTGRTTGPHLHFAVTRDGAAIDPSGLLRPGWSATTPAPKARLARTTEV